MPDMPGTLQKCIRYDPVTKRAELKIFHEGVVVSASNHAHVEASGLVNKLFIFFLGINAIKTIRIQ